MRDTARDGSAVVALISVQAIPMRLTDEKFVGLFDGTGKPDFREVCIGLAREPAGV